MAILGEFRTIPGYTVGEVLGSFYKEYHALLEKAKKNGLEIAIKNYEEVPADLWEAHSAHNIHFSSNVSRNYGIAEEKYTPTVLITTY